MVKSLEAALVALLAVVSLAWLCLKIEALGVFETIRSAVRRMSAFQRFAAAAFLAVFIVFASEKTNSPPMNLPGPILPPSVLVPVQPGLSPSSCGIPVPLPAEPFAVPPEGAVTNFRWFLRGAFEDAVRIPFPDADGFPWYGGMATALTVFASGEFRPDAATAYFPAPFDAPLSLPPLSRRDPSAPSFFWHAATPSNSLITTWENGLYGRDLSHPTNLQAEFFADGSFVYRYPDRTTAYPPVLPFDWDGDGLENSVDPDPEAPGPDAHGTNAEWYGVVCSNILSATDGPYGVSLSWCDGANSNAYYFVDVVAERGPAPIYFTDAAGAVSGDPVVVALAGATNRVPLVIGPLYSVTSTVPFSISVAEDSIGRPTDGSVQVQPRDGGGYDVRWPVHFSYREESEGEFTVDSEPDGLELEFNWDVPGGVPAMNVQGFISPVLPGFSPLQLPRIISPPRILGSPSAGWCFDVDGSNVVKDCEGNSDCRGCTLSGHVSHVGHSVDLPTMTCGCTDPDDPHEPEEQQHDPSQPSFSVGFSESAVIYEDAYVDAPGVTVQKRSTEVRVTISVDGGENGGRFVVTKVNLGKLSQVESIVIPDSGNLEAYGSLHRSVRCVGDSPSAEAGDVKISGYFVENGTGRRINYNGSTLTVFKVELRPQKLAPLNTCVNRHTYGVYELVDCLHSPDVSLVSWQLSGAGNTTNSPEGGVVNREGGAVLRCPLTGSGKQLKVSYGGVEYSPLTSLQEPTNIVAETWTCYCPEGRDPAHAGDIALRLGLYVYPKTVNFGNIALVEVPWTQGGSVTGYYALPEHAAGRYHDDHHGAGVWHSVSNGNFWATDSAGCRPITNWMAGTKTWDIPIGWDDASKSKPLIDANPDTAKILGMFHQHFEIYSNGTVRVDKFGHWASRGLSSNPEGPDDGEVLLDGNVFNPLPGNQSPSTQNHGGLILWTY